jgi:hypothetical protein
LQKGGKADPKLSQSERLRQVLETYAHKVYPVTTLFHLCLLLI